MSRRTRPYQTSDLERLRVVGSRSFGIDDVSMVDAWIERGTPEQWRVHEVDGRVQGMALRVPMGIWFGGRSLRTLGFAGVATAPEARDDGVGAAMMRDALIEAREEGFGLSTLNPSTREFYGKLGYALAGDHFEVDIDLARMPAVEAHAKVVPVAEGVPEALRALRTEVHRTRHGAIDRGPYVWRRVHDPARRRADGYFFEVEGQIEGYAYVSLPSGGLFYDVRLMDWCVRSPEGLAALARFLRGYRSMASRLTYAGNAQDELTALTPARAAQVKLEEVHMLRVLDPVRALAERGYPTSVNDTLHLRVVDDPIFADNVGDYVLRVRGGRAEVWRGAAGTAPLELDVEGLAGLYTAYHDVPTLDRMGKVAGNHETLAAAARIFGAPRAYLDHMY